MYMNYPFKAWVIQLVPNQNEAKESKNLHYPWGEL